MLGEPVPAREAPRAPETPKAATVSEPTPAHPTPHSALGTQGRRPSPEAFCPPSCG